MHQGRWIKFSLLLALLPGAGLASPEFPSPALPSGSLGLQNTATLAGYNPEHKQADWVFYPLADAELRDCFQRGNSFRPDSRLPSGTAAQLSDYTGSGYDRGHLSPAGDNKWSQLAMNESFLLSNVSPQPPAFNRGIWGQLESLVRAWAHDMGGLWVATGPILHSGLSSIGSNHISVPEYFYKVLATQKGDHHEAIAFLLPTNASGNFEQYAMSVRQLEGISGLDFLSGLSDEEQAETTLNPKGWNFQAHFNYLPCQSISPTTLEWSWGMSTLPR